MKIKLFLLFGLFLLVFCKYDYSQCTVANAIYVAPSAKGSGTASSPTDLISALAIHEANPARTQIYMAGGNYNFYSTISLPSNISIDGSYRDNKGAWVKDPNFSTNLLINPNFSFAQVITDYYDTVTVAHLIGIELDSVQNIVLENFSITVWNSSQPYLASRDGNSVYGIHSYYTSNITLFNLNITTNDAGRAGDGQYGRNGYPPYGMEGGGTQINYTLTKDIYNPVYYIVPESNPYSAGGAGGIGGQVQQYVNCSGPSCLGNGCMPQSPAPTGASGGGSGYNQYYYEVGGGPGGTCGNACTLECFLGQYSTELGVTEAAFNEVFGNSLPVSPPPNPQGQVGYDGSNGSDGQDYSTYPPQRSYEMDRYYVPSTGLNGGNGSGGGGGGGGGAGGIETLTIPSAPGPAGIVTDILKASLQGAALLDQLAGNGDVCAGEVLNASTPGGSGGGGGEGGIGGGGGGGGGSVFGIYNYRGNSIAAGNISYNLGAAGTGGQGGQGGYGANGYPGGPGPEPYSGLSGISDQGANGGMGGTGGNGGGGMAGGNGYVYRTWGVNGNMAFALDTAHLCTNSIIGIVKDTTSYLYYQQDGLNVISTASDYVQVYVTSPGTFSVFQASPSTNGFANRTFKVTKQRSAPAFTMKSIVCNYDTVSVIASDTTEQGYSWRVWDGSGNTVAVSSTPRLKFFPSVSGEYYTVSLSIFETCCGWSTAAVHSFYTQPSFSPSVSMYSGFVPPYCYGTYSTELQATPGSGTPGNWPHGITWSNGVKDTDIVSAKDSGVYSVTYTSPEGCVSNSIKNFPMLIYALPTGKPVTPDVHGVCFGSEIQVDPVYTPGYAFNFYANATNQHPLQSGQQSYGYTFQPYFGVGSGTVDSVVVYTALVYGLTGCVSNERGTAVVYHETYPPMPLVPYDQNYWASTSGQCGQYVGFAAPPADYVSCGGFVVAKQISGLSPGSFFPVGTSQVVFRLSDDFGNTNDLTTTITVTDATPPTITSSPHDTTLYTSHGTCTARYNFKSATATDICPGKLSSRIYTSMGYYDGDSLFSGTSGNTGITQLTFWFSDSAKNYVTTTMNVTVRDTQAPVLTCPANQVHYLSPNSKIVYTGYNLPVVTDNCYAVISQPLLDSGFGQFGAHYAGTTTQVYSYRDISNNTGTCSFKITVLDTIKPVITCPDAVSFPNERGLSYAKITYGTPTAIDNASSFVNIALLSGKASGDTAKIGVYTAIWTATDSSGNTASCPVKITVFDTSAPHLVCPSNISQGNDPGLCSAVINYTVAPALDLDGKFYTPTLIPGEGLPSGSAFPMGNTIVLYRAIDAAGNQAYCSFNVDIQDTVKPVFTSPCPHDTSVNVIPAICGKNLALPVLTGTDNSCNPPSIAWISGSYSGYFQKGTTYQSYRIEDQFGNQRTCAYNVTVVDPNTLTVVCPNNIVENADAGYCTSSVNFPQPTVTPYYNTCMSSGYSYSFGLQPGAPFPLGNTTVTYTVSANGQSTGCTFTVTVNDNEKPSITAPANIVVNIDSGNCGKVVNFTAPVGTATCTNGLNTFLTSGLPSGFVFPIGTTVETYVVGTLQGNTDTARFKITVRDTINPHIPAQAEVDSGTSNICGMAVNFTTPVGTDNSSCVSTYKIKGLNSGEWFPLGTTQEVYIARDSAGNTDTCRFNIVVKPQYPLQSNCMTPWLQADPTGNGAVVYYPVPGIVDQYTGQLNCAGVQVLLKSGLGSGAYFNDGAHPENYIFVVKGTGDTVKCSIDVILTDPYYTPSIINCGTVQQYTVHPDSGSCNATFIVPGPTATAFAIGPLTISYTVDGAMDTSHIFTPGSHTVTFTATDNSGDQGSCSVYVNVLSNTAIGNSFQGIRFCEGEAASLNPELTGNITGVTYNWITSNSQGDYYTISTDSVLSFNPIKLSDQNQYHLIVTDRCGISIRGGEFNLNVTPGPATTLAGLSASYCIYDSTDIPLSFSPPGGFLGGQGISGNNFNPKKAGAGVHIITYAYADTVSGCTGISTDTVNVYAAPLISVFADSVYCINSGTIQLPLANTYTGAGISGTIFNPLTAGAGKHILTGVLTLNGCSASMSENIRVNTSIPGAKITAPSTVCSASGNYIISAATKGGTWSGKYLSTDSLTGSTLFNSRMASDGKDTISYSITKNACTSTDTVMINVLNRSDSVPFTFFQFCTTGAPVQFDTTRGRQYSGVGFTNNVFTPSAAGPRGPKFYTIISTNSLGCIDTSYRLLNLLGGQLDIYKNQLVCKTGDSVFINLRTQYDSISWSNGSHSNTKWLKATGEYPVYLRDTLGCAGSDTVYVNLFAKPDSILFGLTSVYACPKDSVVIQADTSFSGYLWNNGKTTSSINALPGNYSVRVLTSNGCYYQSDTLNVHTSPDITPPVITCPADTVFYTSSGRCSVSGIFIGIPGTFDNCGIASVTNNAPLSGIYPLGIDSITWTATDNSNNSKTCLQKVTVKDSIKPYFSTLPSTLFFSDTALNNCSSKVPDFVALVKASDSCAAVSISQNPAAGIFVTKQITPVVITASDPSGNQASITVFFQSLDTVMPVVKCPSDITVNATDTAKTAIVTYTAPVRALNCINSSVRRISGLGSGSAFPIGTTIEKFLVTDSSGAGDTCSFRITVNPPTGIAQNAIHDNSLSVSPVPTSDLLNIVYRNDKALTLQVKLSNAVGQVIMNEAITQFNGSYTKTFNMFSLPVGIYTLEMISDRGVVTRKVVKI